MNIYEECPILKNDLITMRKTEMEDAKSLLECYSDKSAVKFFNSDNCHGDDFYYSSMERMRKAIEFWNYSYENRCFIRFTVILNATKEIIGTIEMFHRLTEDEFNHYGVLRIDLKSSSEKEKVVDAILDIVNRNFYELFDVKIIVTKAIAEAEERVVSLIKNGYKKMDRKFVIYNDYFHREQAQNIKIQEPQSDDEGSIEKLLSTTINTAFVEQEIGHLTDFIKDEIDGKMRMLRSFINGNREYYFLIAKVDNKAVGIISFGKCGDIIKECCEGRLNDVGELGSLYVLPEYQNQGIGSKLIDSLINYLKSMEIKSYCLDSGYKKAQKKWIRKFGEPYKIMKDYWGLDSDHYIWYCQVL